MTERAPAESTEVVEWEEEEGGEVGVGLVARLMTSTRTRTTFWASTRVRFKDLNASSMTAMCISLYS